MHERCVHADQTRPESSFVPAREMDNIGIIEKVNND